MMRKYFEKASRFISGFIGIAMLAMLLIAPIPATAGIASSFSDVISTNSVSVGANHTIRFVTSTGVDSSTDTIRLTFASGFNLASLSAPNDFDLAVGSTSVCSSAVFIDKTLAAGAAAGVWQVGVSGQTVIFTAPTDAAPGEIIAGRCVMVEVGTNATSGVAGTNKIVNPASAGSKTVWLSGTFGDSADAGIAVSSPGQVIVNATVTGSSGGGNNNNNNNPPLPDTIPPALTIPSVPVIGPTNVEIRWETNEVANSAIDYGLTAAYEIGSVTADTYAFSRQLPIGGLSSSTLYHFRVRSSDSSSNQTSSADYTFTTLAVADVTPPVISGIDITDNAGISVAVGWITDEDSDSKVEYGLTTEYGSSVTSAVAVKAHYLNLTGLTSMATYHFRVTSKDAANNSTSSADGVFETNDVVSPVVTGPTVSEITKDSAKIGWSTDEASVVDLDYGTTIEYGQSLVAPIGLGGSLSMPSLVQNTEYFYRLKATDAFMNFTVKTGTFKTLRDLVPPGRVTGLAIATDDSRLTLSWVNPADADFVGVVIRRKLTGAPASYDDGALIYTGPGSSFTESDLLNGREYFYGVFAFDTLNNYSVGTFANATPVLPIVPPRCGDDICNGRETVFSCPTDCRAPQEVLPVCGDGVCNGAETNDICPVDCHLAAVCGNGSCEVGENNAICPADCASQVVPLPGEPPVTEVPPPGTVPVPPVEPVTDLGPHDLGIIKSGDIKVFIKKSGIVVSQGVDGSFRVPKGVELIIAVPDQVLSGEVRAATVTFDGKIIPMYRGGSYDALLEMPENAGKLTANIHIGYVDGNFDNEDIIFDVASPGYVYEKLESKQASLDGITVKLYEHTGGKHEIVSAVTDSNGNFAFVVPPGRYSVRAFKDGYGDSESSVAYEASYVTPVIELTKIVSLQEILQSSAPVAEKASQIAAQAAIQVQIIRDNPVVQRQAEVTIAPAATTVAVVNAVTIATASTVVNTGAWFQYLFFQPILWFSRRKRKNWGSVYDSLTKMPVALAVVRLLDAATGRLLQSRVTDKQGRYFFIADTGRYKITVTKPGYNFPSAFMKKAKEDLKFTELYYSEEIEVADAGSTLAANIPLDPVGKPMVPAAQVIFKSGLRKLQQAFSVVGVLAGILAAYLNPTTLTISLLVMQVVLFVIFRVIAKGKKPKGWGIVYDKNTNAPLRNAIVRIFEPKYNKLLDTYVTDAQGRYAFIVGPSVYYTTYERSGYLPNRLDDLDYTKSQENALINNNVPLEPGTVLPVSRSADEAQGNS
ncbi:MAG: carboxypeptidase regulatory-like domain-containing protein [bacterium]